MTVFRPINSIDSAAEAIEQSVNITETSTVKFLKHFLPLSMKVKLPVTFLLIRRILVEIEN